MVALKKNVVLEELKNVSIDKYDFDNAIVPIIQKYIRDNNNIWIDNKDIIITDDINNSNISTIKHIVAKYGSMEDYKLFRVYDSLKGNCWLNDINLNKVTGRVVSYGVITFTSFLPSFIRFMDYVINGIWEKDLSKSYTVMGSVMTHEEQYYNSGVYSFEGFKVQLYKNQKVIFTFDDVDVANKVIDAWNYARTVEHRASIYREC
jgi:hypothetical protein